MMGVLPVEAMIAGSSGGRIHGKGERVHEGKSEERCS